MSTSPPRHRSRSAARLLAGSAVIVGFAAAATLGGAAGPPAAKDAGGDRSPVHRTLRPRAERTLPPAVAAAGAPASYPGEFRTIDGVGNNPLEPLRGAAGGVFVRAIAPDYADGTDAPAGADRPSARTVSNALCSQAVMHENALGFSDYLWQWGQFLDHDITETPIGDPAEAFDVPVPAGDRWFDPSGSGTATIPLDRSAHVHVAGVRRQLNHITAFVDASNVYGSDPDRARALRTLDGTGRLATSAGDLLPWNEHGLDNAPSNDPGFFLAGDIRANEQVGLTALHVLFVREHNHWAGVVAAAEPGLSGDEIHERARAIVAAEMQAITYRAFVPCLLGPDALPPYAGYDPSVDAGISNVFATAAFRVGHTMLSPQLMRLGPDMQPIAAGHLSLASAFFAPGEIVEHGIEPVLRGLCAQTAQEVDAKVIDEVRNFLFGPPGAGGFDLASLNVQRGRDHGLPSYNAVRAAVGLAPARTFAEVTPDPVLQANFETAYGDPDAIDAWIGLLAEPHRPGAMVGETLFRVLRDQFVRLRDGDRFWYEAYLPADLVALVEQQTLAVIIRRNTEIAGELPDDVFKAPPACAADLDGDGAVGLDDLLAVLAGWGDCAGCPGDVNADGLVGLDDLLAVLAAWGPCAG